MWCIIHILLICHTLHYFFQFESTLSVMVTGKWCPYFYLDPRAFPSYPLQWFSWEGQVNELLVGVLHTTRLDYHTFTETKTAPFFSLLQSGIGSQLPPAPCTQRAVVFQAVTGGGCHPLPSWAIPEPKLEQSRQQPLAPAQGLNQWPDQAMWRSSLCTAGSVHSWGNPQLKAETVLTRLKSILSHRHMFFFHNPCIFHLIYYFYIISFLRGHSTNKWYFIQKMWTTIKCDVMTD